MNMNVRAFVETMIGKKRKTRVLKIPVKAVIHKLYYWRASSTINARKSPPVLGIDTSLASKNCFKFYKAQQIKPKALFFSNSCCGAPIFM